MAAVVSTKLTPVNRVARVTQVPDASSRATLSADSVARAIVYAIEQPADVDINEIVLRPTVQEF